MIPVADLHISGREKKMLQLFRKLNREQQESVQAFAEFLLSRTEDNDAVQEEIPEPQPIPRPEEESVVKAIKRLTATYPMIDRQSILNQTSALMAQHIMQGRAAAEVIDELEVIFRTHYEKLLSRDD